MITLKTLNAYLISFPNVVYAKPSDATPIKCSENILWIFGILPHPNTTLEKYDSQAQGEMGLNTFRRVPEDCNPLPEAHIVRSYFQSIGYSEDIPAKGTLKKDDLYSKLEKKKREKIMVYTSEVKAPMNTTRAGEGDSKGTKPGAKTGCRKRNILMDVEMHKEDLQAASGQSSLGPTGEERVDPQLNRIPQQQGTDEGTKNIFIDLNFSGTFSQDPTAEETPADNEPFAEETPTPETTKGDNAEASTTGDYMEDFTPLIPKLDADEVAKEWGLDEDTQLILMRIKELTNQVLILLSRMLKLQEKKSKAKAEDALLRAQPKFPSKLNNSTASVFPTKVKELCQGVAELKERISRVSSSLDRIGDALSTAGGQPAGVHNKKKAELPKKTSPYPQQPPPSKPFTFTSLFTNTSPAQSKGKPSKVSKVEKGKDLLQHIESDSTSHISTCGPKAESKVIKRLIRLGHLTPEELAQQQILADEGKKAVEEAKKDKARKELYKDLGEDLVNEFFKKRVMYERYYKIMMNRRNPSSITRVDIIDAAHENLKKMGKVLNIQPGVPLSESDPVLELNRLTKTKIKNLGDLFRTTKKYKSPVQFDDHPSGTVLNEPKLGMITYNNHERQDFISIDDLKELNNEMLYTVLCPLMEVDSRNMDPKVQMRLKESPAERMSSTRKVQLKKVQLKDVQQMEGSAKLKHDQLKTTSAEEKSTEDGSVLTLPEY
ncbi:hypothetical protein Tco_1249527 [Tanacetum coccineum]